MANMSNAEIQRRKKLQGRITQTTSTLGLTALGIGGMAHAAKRPGGLARLRKIPGMQKTTHDSLREMSQNTALLGSGVAGAGGYNFAAYTKGESKKRPPVAPKKTPVRKSMDIEPTYGEVGFSKAWEPTVRNYDPEAQRRNRNSAQVAGLATGGGAALGGAEAMRRKSGRLKRVATQQSDLSSRYGKDNPTQARAAKGRAARATTSATRATKAARGLGAAGVAGLGGASYVAARRRSESWGSY